MSHIHLSKQELLDEVDRLNKVVVALMSRVEKNMDFQGDAFSVFQSNIALEHKVRERTEKLQSAEKELIESNTKLRELNENLEVEKRLAESASIAKSTFLANMSHEIRTPLHGILSFARYGIEESEDVERSELKKNFLEIKECGESLLTLINGLLEMAKLESGSMIYEFKPNDFSYTLDLAISEFQMIAKEKNLTFRVGNIREFVFFYDAIKIQQVLRNLISNAVKYAFIGSEIRIETVYSDFGLVCSVSNRGVSIPESELRDIFNMFVQSSNTADGAGGTGLGLSICQAIVKAHSGKIWARNTGGEEVTFFFSLPTDKNTYGRKTA